MSLTQVGEPPNIADSDTESHTGEDVLGFVAPLGPVFYLFLILPLQILIWKNPLFESGVWQNQPHGDHAVLKMSHRLSEMSECKLNLRGCAVLTPFMIFHFIAAIQRLAAAYFGLAVWY